MANVPETTEKLLEYLGDSLSGMGSLVVLSGPPIRDIVVDELVSEAEGMGVIVKEGRCHSNASPYSPIAPMIAEAGDGMVTISRENVYIPFQADRSFRLEFDCLDMLRRASTRCPVLIILRDAQSADVGTIGLLRFLARNITDMEVMMVVTAGIGPVEVVDVALQRLEEVGRTHYLHVHDGPVDGAQEVMVPHPTIAQALPFGEKGECRMSGGDEVLQQVRSILEASESSLHVGHPREAAELAEAARSKGVIEGHRGAELESLLMAGSAYFQAGEESRAIEVLDKAASMAWMIEDAGSERQAHLIGAMLRHFSTGEPDAAREEALAALDQTSMTGMRMHGSIPLSLLSMVESKFGRKDTAEKLYCDAAGLAPDIEVAIPLERTMLALAAAELLDRRQEFKACNQRFAEAEIFARGTEHPTYWVAMVRSMHGRSLLRQNRPKEASMVLEEAAGLFDDLGNTAQSDRARRPPDS